MASPHPHPFLFLRLRFNRGPFPSQGIFPTQRSNPGLQHCRQVDSLRSEPPGKLRIGCHPPLDLQEASQAAFNLRRLSLGLQNVALVFPPASFPLPLLKSQCSARLCLPTRLFRTLLHSSLFQKSYPIQCFQLVLVAEAQAYMPVYWILRFICPNNS